MKSRREIQNFQENFRKGDADRFTAEVEVFFIGDWGMGISVRVAGGEWLVAGKGF
jgi:hypothetical protein